MAGIGTRLCSTWPEDKLQYIKRYKFTIAFENQTSPGYVTEKILHAFLVKSIPIYWGDPDVTEYFNPESFINCHAFHNFDEVIQYIKEVDSNERLYYKHLFSPPFLPSSKLYNLRIGSIFDHLKDIIDNSVIYYLND